MELIAYVGGWRVVVDNKWTRFEARRRDASVVLESGSFEGITDLIAMRCGLHWKELYQRLSIV